MMISPLKIGETQLFSGISLSRPGNEAVQKIVHALFHQGDLNNTLTFKHFKAVFWKKDNEMLQQFKEALQEKLTTLADNLPEGEDPFIWQAFLGNVLAILPYAYPQDGDTFTIPKCDGTRITYTVQILPLSMTRVAKPMQAVALTAEGESPILIFSGTTYPSGDGFFTTLLSDTTPFKSVGEAVYEESFKPLDHWFKDKSEVHAIGQSLGGALCLHALRKHGDKLARIDAYSPPGLYASCLRDLPTRELPVNIYMQTGDLVPKVGYFPMSDNVNLYHVTPIDDSGLKGKIAYHARSLTGCEQVEITRLDPAVINQKLGRKVLTGLHRVLGSIFVYLPLKIALFAVWIFKQISEAIASCCCRFANMLTNQRKIPILSGENKELEDGKSIH